MTTTSPATNTSVPTAAPAASSTTSSAVQELSGNFNTFLTLLTTQLKNQDPLSPMDSNQFTQQLVEFSQVEQQIDTNTNLNTLITQGQSQSGAYAVNYLGKQVTVTNGQAALQNGSANWTYALGTAAQATLLTVSDASGKVVYSGAGETQPGDHNFVWNGEDNNGNVLPDGAYTLSAAAKAGDGSDVTTSVQSTGTVSEVDLSGTAPKVAIGPLSLDLSQIAALKN